MTTMVIVDDEPVIRQGIRTAINWAGHGIRIVGEAANGSEALRKAVDLNPDIILTDIRMPVMDGLVMIEKLREISLRARIIIMTAHDETRYYAKAMSMGICDFILKNADADAICAMVEKVAREIQLDNGVGDEERQIGSLLKEQMFTLQSSFMGDVLSGRETAEGISEKAARLNLLLTGPFYALIMADIKETDWWAAVNFTLQIFTGFNPFIFHYRDEYFTVLINIPDADRGIIETYTANLVKIAPFGRCAAMAPLYSLSELPAAGIKTLVWIDRCCWVPAGSCFFIPTDISPAPVPIQAILSTETRFIRDTASRDTELLGADLERWYNEMRNCQAPLPVFTASAQRMAAAIDSDEGGQTAAGISRLTYAPEVYRVLRETLDTHYSEQKSGDPIVTILEYARAHFTQELCLADLAKMVYLSPAYLSKIFKQRTGYKFIDWLNRQRLEMAKTLLLQNELKHYEIAEKVGYTSYKQFSQCFRKYYGCSAKKFAIDNLTAVKSFN